MATPALQVGPSERVAEWRDFFYAPHWSEQEFRALVAADGPGRALFQIETIINGLYEWAERAQRIDHPKAKEALEEAHFKSSWLSTHSREVRQALGPLQRDLDVGVLRWIRRGACLSIVIGAGATIAADGPSWPTLVRRLLALALERGYEITTMRETSESTPERPAARREVIEVKRLNAADAERARHIVAAIDDGGADTELLMQGAQLCHDLMGQHLFTDITGVLYENQRQPSRIHHAIAELAEPLFLRDPERGGWYPGWQSIITYNFDDLLGEALDARGLPRTVHVMYDERYGNKIAAYQSERARETPKSEPQLDIYHLHGYTPRRLADITHVQFIFSTSQYQRSYAGQTRSGIIDYAFNCALARPVHHALYVGCSFEDKVMNDLLSAAAAQLPGRYHYAIVQWKGPRPCAQSSADDITLASVRYEAIGVRPIWFDRHDEIPDLVRCLA